MDSNGLNHPSSPVLMALRARTAERHALIDRSLPLSHARPTVLAYREHLQLIHAWLNPLEQSLQRFADGPQNPSVIAIVNRTSLIERDLSDLGAVWRTAPTAAPWPSMDRLGPDYRWGTCYVLEGMQLGGAVLYRRVAALVEPRTARFLTGNSMPPMPRWRRFIQALDAHVRGEQAVARACDGAADAFDSLIALLAPELVKPSADACHG